MLRYQSRGLSTLWGTHRGRQGVPAGSLPRPEPALTERDASGIPVSSTGPIPSYFTQRLSHRLLSLVQVADPPGGRGQVGTHLGPGMGGAGIGAPGAFSSLAGQVWYHSFTGDKVGMAQVGIAQGTPRAVPRDAQGRT